MGGFISFKWLGRFHLAAFFLSHWYRCRWYRCRWHRNHGLRPFFFFSDFRRARCGHQSGVGPVLILSTIGCRGLYFGPKTIFIPTPPPSENDIFSPSCHTSFLDSHRGLFALILPYFAFILPFSSPFLIFFPLSSFFFPLSSIFFYIFPLFLLPFSYFSPKWHWLIFPPPRGYFPIYRPLH